jgi:hypothetical protein
VQPALVALGLGTGGLGTGDLGTGDLDVRLDVGNKRLTDGGLLGRCQQESLVLALDLPLD